MWKMSAVFRVGQVCRGEALENIWQEKSSAILLEYVDPQMVGFGVPAFWLEFTKFI